MAGLEGIAGLSLACNVMQLISFGHEAISMCRRIHESGSPEPGLSEHAESLKAVCDGLEKSLGKRPTPVATTAPTSAATRAPTMEKRLLELAAKCVKNARDLQEEMKFLSPSQPGKLGALVAAPKILWRKRRLERLKGNLDDAQRLMDTSVLERLFARAEALYQANNKGFTDLSKELQRFITDHAASNSILRTVVETHAKEIQDHVTMASSKTQNEIKSHVSLKLSSHEISIMNHVSSSAQDVQDTFSQRMTSREDSKAKELAFQQLLKSLKYPGMNERRNQISPTHPKTFRWIFSNTFQFNDWDSGSDGESEWLAEDDSSTHSDEPAEVDSTIIWSEDSVESSGSFRSSKPSLESTKPQPWDSFVDWLKDDPRKIYWISGKPGSGKSTLMKYIETNDSNIKSREPAIRILSHYLWRPGTFMQQSIKGLLCSLLHQVLSEDERTSMEVLKRQPYILRKDADTDWTARELEITLLYVLRNSAYLHLVLLDGLDEVADTPDEGVCRLLSLINDLVMSNRVKVCVSSRPEPALKRVLEKHPMLKMQDLNNRDIHLLTRERIEAMQFDANNYTTNHLSNLICEKAEGVFIWVILVLNSLKRGLDNYDDMDTLYSRVESLPKDLTKLYKEMWSRMKEDSDLYRRKTVLLFYMAIEYKTHSESALIWHGNANLLGLAISTDDEMLESFMASHGWELPDAELLWQKWHRLGRRLPAMCAGLLDITKPEEAFTSPNCNENKFKPWGKTGIGFTHRTAVDFICASEEGIDIRLSEAASSFFSKSVP
ncbi:NACHT domain-containing protein [Colletotrichum scovillei]|uniref:NACHT domain-containing protein n=1 Tax=Colletotrichum scovillei TaxID=1209932 RepID=A0A9P7QYP9_9PEZI|nr:NACHT domain-containing protein [Colletotrichum scovillei]KAG7046147.1 NACHT domain-containing protein [Colletotrichum scovillei]KAG7063492.1 NACHT domain-containing protein [Colletotrichum scovillei]